MFCIDPAPTFVAQVPISYPGRPAPLEVEIEFVYKNAIQIKEWIASSRNKADADLLFEIIKGWAGLIDIKGESVPFSLSNLEKLIINFPAARGEIFNFYVKETTEAKRKN